MKRSIFSIVTSVSVAVCLMFCGFRIGFVLADHEVFSGFCHLLWFLFIINSVVMMFQLRARLKDNKPVGKAAFRWDYYKSRQECSDLAIKKQSIQKNKLIFG